MWSSVYVFYSTSSYFVEKSVGILIFYELVISECVSYKSTNLKCHEDILNIRESNIWKYYHNTLLRGEDMDTHTHTWSISMTWILYTLIKFKSRLGVMYGYNMVHGTVVHAGPNSPKKRPASLFPNFEKEGFHIKTHS